MSLVGSGSDGALVLNKGVRRRGVGHQLTRKIHSWANI